MKTVIQSALRRTPTGVYVILVAFIAFSFGRMGSQPSDDAEPESQTEHDHDAEEYVCPMHPQIRQDEFGTCPICFMDLVPVETDGGAESAITLTMSESAAALARVRTTPVARVPLERRIDVFGRVATTDEGHANITAWTGGRIERLYVETIGEEVRRGQRLARIYSPELVVAQETLIHARQILRDAQAAQSESRAAAAEAAEHAAMTELRLLGVSDRQIEDLVADGEADESVIIYAAAGGTVLHRHVSEGDHVGRGTPILELANLDEVWIQLEIYERDLPYVSVGAPVELRVPGVGEAAMDGEIAFIDPVVDPARRIARARVVVENDDGGLRPDMFVEASIVSSVLDHRGRAPLSVPSSAVLWTGLRSLVYVWDPTESPPIYMPIEVVLGERIGERQVIESGIFEDEEVVAEGAFRLDASLQIRGGRTMMHPSGDAGQTRQHEH